MKNRAVFTPVIALGLSALLLSGCGSSKLNPLNWFGGSKEETVAVMDNSVLTDNRPLVARVTSFKIDRTPGGAILRAVGLPPTQGYWDAELVAENDGKPEKGVLSFQFHIQKPYDAENAGPPKSREVVVAYFITNNSLQNVRKIRIRGAQNARTVRRR